MRRVTIFMFLVAPLLIYRSSFAENEKFVFVDKYITFLREYAHIKSKVSNVEQLDILLQDLKSDDLWLQEAARSANLSADLLRQASTFNKEQSADKYFNKSLQATEALDYSAMYLIKGVMEKSSTRDGELKHGLDNKEREKLIHKLNNLKRDRLIASEPSLNKTVQMIIDFLSANTQEELIKTAKTAPLTKGES